MKGMFLMSRTGKEIIPHRISVWRKKDRVIISTKSPQEVGLGLELRGQNLESISLGWSIFNAIRKFSSSYNISCAKF